MNLKQIQIIALTMTLILSASEGRAELIRYSLGNHGVYNGATGSGFVNIIAYNGNQYPALESYAVGFSTSGNGTLTLSNSSQWSFSAYFSTKNITSDFISLVGLKGYWPVVGEIIGGSLYIPLINGQIQSGGQLLIELDESTVVPEPSTFVLAMIGLTTFILSWRFKGEWAYKSVGQST